MTDTHQKLLGNTLWKIAAFTCHGKWKARLQPLRDMLVLLGRVLVSSGNIMEIGCDLESCMHIPAHRGHRFRRIVDSKTEHRGQQNGASWTAKRSIVDSTRDIA